MSLRLTAVIAACLAAAPAIAREAPSYDIDVAKIAVYDRDAWSREITDCDRLAAHPNDPEHVGEGVERADMDLDAAIAACTEAVGADPGNPRLNYQLARAYGYAGRHAEGAEPRMAALMAGYPQSLFVFGYIRITGWDGAPPTPCLGGQLVRLSAQAGRFAGLVGFPHYVLTGAFEGCADVVVDPAEIGAFLDEAQEIAGGDYYHGILIAQLRHELAETYPDPEPADE